MKIFQLALKITTVHYILANSKDEVLKYISSKYKDLDMNSIRPEDIAIIASCNTFEDILNFKDDFKVYHHDLCTVYGVDTEEKPGWSNIVFERDLEKVENSFKNKVPISIGWFDFL